MPGRRLWVLLLLVGCGYENSQLRLRTVLDEQQDKFRRCYTQALLNDSELEGTLRMVVRVRARGNGQIESVEPYGESSMTNPQLHDPLQRCLERALVGLSIGNVPIQDDLAVEYLFQFAPGAEPTVETTSMYDPGPARGPGAR